VSRQTPEHGGAADESVHKVLFRNIRSERQKFGHHGQVRLAYSSLGILLRFVIATLALFGVVACDGSIAGTRPQASPVITFAGVPPRVLALQVPRASAVPPISERQAVANAEMQFAQFKVPGARIEAHLGMTTAGNLVWAVACQCTYPSDGDCGIVTGTACPSPAPNTYFFDVINATSGDMVTAGGG
jgi:hypothetical protein